MVSPFYPNFCWHSLSQPTKKMARLNSSGWMVIYRDGLHLLPPPKARKCLRNLSGNTPAAKTYGQKILTLTSNVITFSFQKASQYSKLFCCCHFNQSMFPCCATYFHYFYKLFFLLLCNNLQTIKMKHSNIFSPRAVFATNAF